MFDILQQVDPAAATWGALFSAAGAIGTSVVLATVKRTEAKFARNQLFRKAQPIITLLGAVAAPYVASIASSHVDISGLGQAPVATLATVIGAELFAMLKRSV